MSIALAALLVISHIQAQELGTALSTVHSTQPPLPLLDLFPGATNYISDSIRKSYGESGYGHPICPTYKSDSLSAFANILGNAAKIMLAAVTITFLKTVAGKLLLLPFTVLLMVKIGIKTLLLWPILLKLMKYFKRRKKKIYKGRSIGDCSKRIACVIRQTVDAGWGNNLGAAVAFSVMKNIDNDSSYSHLLVNVLAGEKIAECMKIVCGEGADIS